MSTWKTPVGKNILSETLYLPVNEEIQPKKCTVWTIARKIPNFIYHFRAVFQKIVCRYGEKERV
jgi:hypothetical protein